ncbi:MAG: hypothetical protein Kow00114_27250 [Kiloniellaceae bacterium]
MKGCALPTLGYPTRWQAAAALRREGLGPTAIARRIGISVSAATSLLDYAKKKKGGAVLRDVAVDAEILEALRPDAAARGLSCNDLVRRILARIAEDRLVAAVLDDAEETGRAG